MIIVERGLGRRLLSLLILPYILNNAEGMSGMPNFSNQDSVQIIPVQLACHANPRYFPPTVMGAKSEKLRQSTLRY